MNITKDDITMKRNYSITHKIGMWAKDKGYDGILAPSARDKSGFNLVILKA